MQTEHGWYIPSTKPKPERLAPGYGCADPSKCARCVDAVFRNTDIIFQRSFVMLGLTGEEILTECKKLLAMAMDMAWSEWTNNNPEGRII
jgi:hypothetical protein